MMSGIEWKRLQVRPAAVSAVLLVTTASLIAGCGSKQQSETAKETTQQSLVSPPQKREKRTTQANSKPSLNPKKGISDPRNSDSQIKVSGQPGKTREQNDKTPQQLHREKPRTSTNQGRHPAQVRAPETPATTQETDQGKSGRNRVESTVAAGQVPGNDTNQGAP